MCGFVRRELQESAGQCKCSLRSVSGGFCPGIAPGGSWPFIILLIAFGKQLVSSWSPVNVRSMWALWEPYGVLKLPVSDFR